MNILRKPKTTVIAIEVKIYTREAKPLEFVAYSLPQLHEIMQKLYIENVIK